MAPLVGGRPTKPPEYPRARPDREDRHAEVLEVVLLSMSPLLPWWWPPWPWGVMSREDPGESEDSCDSMDRPREWVGRRALPGVWCSPTVDVPPDMTLLVSLRRRLWT